MVLSGPRYSLGILTLGIAAFHCPWSLEIKHNDGIDSQKRVVGNNPETNLLWKRYIMEDNQVPDFALCGISGAVLEMVTLCSITRLIDV